MELLYVDEVLIVANKPAGLLSVPGRGPDKQDCVSQRVQKQYPDALVVHRLDMATSGLLLMARGPVTQRQLSAAFAQRQVHKRYEAIVHGHCDDANHGNHGNHGNHSSNNHIDDHHNSECHWATIELPIALDWPRRPLHTIDPQGKPSTTRWRSMGFDAHTYPGGSTRLLLEPITGRSHQLRVHLQALGHPMVGDALYAPAPIAALCPRLLLHASELRLLHPSSQIPLHFVCPAPF